MLFCANLTANIAQSVLTDLFTSFLKMFIVNFHSNFLSTHLFNVSQIFMLKFNGSYFILTILLFITEVFIGVCVHDDFVRPYIGDVLVVILIYCFVKSFLNTPVIKTAVWVLIFSFFVEVTQYFKLYKILGLQHSPILKTVLGTSFAWADIWAYVAGIAIVLIVEKSTKNL